MVGAHSVVIPRICLVEVEVEVELAAVVLAFCCSCSCLSIWNPVSSERSSSGGRRELPGCRASRETRQKRAGRLLGSRAGGLSG